MEQRKNIYPELARRLEEGVPLALATILEVEDAAPQIPGASAIFSAKGLVTGTLGGGMIEAQAGKKAAECLRDGRSLGYGFDLGGDVNSDEKAICGGSGFVLVDGAPARHRSAFQALSSSLLGRAPGILATRVEFGAAAEVRISRLWAESPGWGEIVDLNEFAPDSEGLEEVFRASRPVLLGKGRGQLPGGGTLLFLEPLFPPSRLVIVGAGHIGQALAHLANLLDFEVTVIDDRAEYANRARFPEANALLVSEVEPALRRFPVSSDTYIVIVTRGHSQDAEALSACIRSSAAYIGMIGSRRKIALMREKFLAERTARAEEFDRVHAPIGLPIGSKTVAEIAVSIAAELVEVRSRSGRPAAGGKG